MHHACPVGYSRIKLIYFGQHLDILYIVHMKWKIMDWYRSYRYQVISSSGKSCKKS